MNKNIFITAPSGSPTGKVLCVCAMEHVDHNDLVKGVELPIRAILDAKEFRLLKLSSVILVGRLVQG